MENLLLQIPSEITKVTTMNHNALRLQIDTQEDLIPQAQAMIFGYKGKPGIFAFSHPDKPIKKDDLLVPEYKPSEEEKKSPSQRLRSVLFLLWEERGKKDLFNNDCDSDTFYRQMMEKIIEHYKQQLK